MDIKEALRRKELKIRVQRTGMYQMLTFTVKKVQIADKYFVEIYTKKLVDMSELKRVANEVGLPVEAENGRAFPEGKGATDFICEDEQSQPNP
ncbi:MAG: hypothetical protein ACP5TL_02595 [Candidatus Micrarchaeia archaeon]